MPPIKRNRHSSEHIDTLEEALKLYPPSEDPGLKPETTKTQRDSAGWILAKTVRRLIQEIVEFHRLFIKLKRNIQWGSEYGIVRKADVDKIDELWKRTYHKFPEEHKNENTDTNTKL